MYHQSIFISTTNSYDEEEEAFEESTRIVPFISNDNQKSTDLTLKNEKVLVKKCINFNLKETFGKPFFYSEEMVKSFLVPDTEVLSVCEIEA